MTAREVRVLVAEDDHLVCELIRSQLALVGCTVVGEAVRGLEAVEMTEALQPDVVLMDIRLPGMDGLEAARRIRESCPTPVVVLTGYESPELIERASAAGVGAYLVKPPSPRQLERVIAIARARFEDMMELRRLNRDLESRNEDLDAYSHTVAHGLQSPLALMIGYAEALRKYRATMSEEEQEQCCRAIEQAGRKMSATIGQLLLLPGSRDTEIQVQPLEMAAIVAAAQRRVASLIEERQAEITLPAAWPAALGYGPWIEEVWVNYLSYAIKQGDEPARTELGATVRRDGAIRFWIRDNSPITVPADQADLFAAFAKLDQVPSKPQGLGMSIARRLVERLGGSVGMESEQGQGTTLTFTLPGASS